MVEMSIQFEEPLAGSYGVVDSFPKDFGYGVEEADIEESSAPSDSKPRILLMGLRRSGKSSIQKVCWIRGVALCLNALFELLCFT